MTALRDLIAAVEQMERQGNLSPENADAIIQKEMERLGITAPVQSGPLITPGGSMKLSPTSVFDRVPMSTFDEFVTPTSTPYVPPTGAAVPAPTGGGAMPWPTPEEEAALRGQATGAPDAPVIPEFTNTPPQATIYNTVQQYLVEALGRGQLTGLTQQQIIDLYIDRLMEEGFSNWQGGIELATNRANINIPPFLETSGHNGPDWGLNPTGAAGATVTTGTNGTGVTTGTNGTNGTGVTNGTNGAGDVILVKSESGEDSFFGGTGGAGGNGGTPGPTPEEQRVLAELQAIIYGGVDLQTWADIYAEIRRSQSVDPDLWKGQDPTDIAKGLLMPGGDGLDDPTKMDIGAGGFAPWGLTYGGPERQETPSQAFSAFQAMQPMSYMPRMRQAYSAAAPLARMQFELQQRDPYAAGSAGVEARESAFRDFLKGGEGSGYGVLRGGPGGGLGERLREVANALTMYGDPQRRNELGATGTQYAQRFADPAMQAAAFALPFQMGSRDPRARSAFESAISDAQQRFMWANPSGTTPEGLGFLPWAMRENLFGIGGLPGFEGTAWQGDDPTARVHPGFNFFPQTG